MCVKKKKRLQYLAVHRILAIKQIQTDVVCIIHGNGLRKPFFKFQKSCTRNVLSFTMILITCFACRTIQIELSNVFFVCCLNNKSKEMCIFFIMYCLIEEYSKLLNRLYDIPGLGQLTLNKPQSGL
jgi:hypothetical protein